MVKTGGRGFAFSKNSMANKAPAGGNWKGSHFNGTGKATRRERFHAERQAAAENCPRSAGRQMGRRPIVEGTERPERKIMRAANPPKGRGGG